MPRSSVCALFFAVMLIGCSSDDSTDGPSRGGLLTLAELDVLCVDFCNACEDANVVGCINRCQDVMDQRSSCRAKYDGEQLACKLDNTCDAACDNDAQFALCLSFDYDPACDEGCAESEVYDTLGDCQRACHWAALQERIADCGCNDWTAECLECVNGEPPLSP